MKERPILFSAPMVRALLAGTKTQTRRVLKTQPAAVERWKHGERTDDTSARYAVLRDDAGKGWANCGPFGCPYGELGDRLWVRETFYAWGRWETRFSAKKGRDEWHFIDLTLECGKSYAYAADGLQPQPMGGRREAGAAPRWWKRPAIHMPRAASRLMLEITGVRVEQLRSISNDDAYDEGVVNWAAEVVKDGNKFPSAQRAFRALWESINGAESWEANPWVWAITFRRIGV